MKYLQITLFCIVIGYLTSCMKTDEITLEIINEDNKIQNQYWLFIPVDTLSTKDASFNKKNFRVYTGSEELPAQLCKTIYGDEILIIIDFSEIKTEKTPLAIRYWEGDSVYTQKKLTQAELWHKTEGKFVDGDYIGGGNFIRVDSLRVPDEYTDHSYFIKYEGPGWESDKVAYRFYLDWRNAVDIFGKKTSEIILHNIGIYGYESYHHMSDWGMDILKVGKSLGIGTLAFWDGGKAVRVEKTDSVICKILNNGNLYSSINTNYYGWKIDGQKFDIQSVLSICAGSRLTKHNLMLDKEIKNISTGIVKNSKAQLLKGPNNTNWSYLATWGKQSLADDSLGMAIFYKNSQKLLLTEDDHSHVIVLKPENNRITYYFMAAWEQEPEGIKSMPKFIAYLNEEVNRLSNPVKIQY